MMPCAPVVLHAFDCSAFEVLRVRDVSFIFRDVSQDAGICPVRAVESGNNSTRRRGEGCLARPTISRSNISQAPDRMPMAVSSHANALKPNCCPPLTGLPLVKALIPFLHLHLVCVLASFSVQASRVVRPSICHSSSRESRKVESVPPTVPAQ
ncbi:uncharacterized protein CC84DRAFT_50091 [Paraphaeosphaeria sporulosa]|uniref:Uncharacterized protein n=1 Tax=Paraphaeosphaeria sporulosa TaxID=1460663 RepID=A0A177CYH5_9PLEO|nr:uncharacterized protein CC84DRAFT_50091 [Paraphaeosphaeria sporulosa]OAG11769.1 hypothetical protein CC84DRAFT_50091 [Paraphaeosphaeria sporulosa]